MGAPTRREPKLYGLVAEFDNTADLLKAANRTREEGYRKIDAYSPFPVHGLAQAVGFRRTWLPLIVLIGGALGCIGGFYLQYWVSVIDYPLNIGGRPLNSWPAFIVITFETTILAAALTTVLAMLGLNGLPTPYHPLFNVERFKLASRDRFFLCVEAGDGKFDRQATRAFLEGFQPIGVYDAEE